jgi:beta-lactamase regulating signal transducer with metallopeptidase domain
MTDLLFQMGLSNACFSLGLAIVAMVVGAKTRRPHLAHMLWLLVFVKLVTPPVVTLPIVTIPAQGETAAAIGDASMPEPVISGSSELNSETSSRLRAAAWNYARVWLPPIWLLGSVVVFGFSMIRVCRFSKLLAAESEVGRQDLQTAAVKIAHRLGLNRIPEIRTTSAHVSPMVWWAGGRVLIVIPMTLLDQMDFQQSQWIVAHELAHVRRRDYLVRWLEWLACVCFWWNPVVWWAQRNLRAAEEICCDELVISCLNPKPRSYANSLLSAVEFLARPALRPPAMASEVNGGGFLERRFKMIVSDNSKRSNSRRLQMCVLLCAVVVLPLGIASAQDYKAVEKRLGEAVANGELSLAQASVMMDALRKAGGAKKQAAKSKSDTDLEGVWEKLTAMVKAGELTKEQAIDKMSEIKREAAKKSQYSDRAQAHLIKVKKQLGELFEAGKISKEEAAKRFVSAQKDIKERMVAGRRQSGPKRLTVEEYKRVEAKMRKMIEDGKAKAEDVERRLIEMRKMIGERGEGERTARGGAQGDYAGFERRLKAAVAQGKMTREEAGEKLASFRRRMAMAGEGERGEKRITREDYARAEAEVKKMVEAGKISKEDMRARLNEMRRMMGDEISDDATGRRR